ncbi:hypothetical protein F6455_01525 [Proteobacteria bacterium 005FR1]|nr:hypothetical protein [Proteobacteria bacterium 005FR1]
MTAGTGYLIGLVLALVLYVAVWVMERDYYKRRHELIRKKMDKLEESKGRGSATVENSTGNRVLGKSESRVSKISRIQR